MKHWIHLLGVVALAGIPAIDAQAMIVHTFDTEASIAGYSQAGGDAGSIITWNGTAGNPGGAIQYVEPASGSVDRLSLPTAFLGDKSAYFNGSFSFDRFSTNGGSPIARDNDVELVGAGLILRYDLTHPTSDTWEEFSLTLNDTGDWIDDATGNAATNTQIQSVLADLDDVILNADFHGSPAESTRFDNISLIPEPASALLLGVGLALLGRRARSAGQRA